MLKIRELRMKRGITTTGMAKLLGVTPAAVSQWEKGKRNPDINTLIKISEILNCTTDEILKR